MHIRQICNGTYSPLLCESSQYYRKVWPCVSRRASHTVLLCRWVIRNLANRTWHPQNTSPRAGHFLSIHSYSLFFSLIFLSRSHPYLNSHNKNILPAALWKGQEDFQNSVQLQSDSTMGSLLTKVKSFFFFPPPENGPDSQQSPVSAWYHNCHK